MLGHFLFKKPEASKLKLGEMKTNLSADLAVAVGAAAAPPPPSANQKAVFTKQSNEKVKSCSLIGPHNQNVTVRA